MTRFRRLATLTALAGLLAAAPAAAQEAAPTFTIDPVHSGVVFTVLHMGISPVPGRFNTFGGEYVLDSANPEKSRVNVEIDATSVDTNNAKRDAHLKGPDFFNSKQFPKITFKSTSVKKNADGYEIAGDLTLRGTTQPATLTMRPTGAGKDPKGVERTGFEGELTVDRLAHGVAFMPEGLGKDVKVHLYVQGMKK